MPSLSADITRIYSISYPQRLEDGIFQHLLGHVPAEIQQKVLRFRRWEDAYGSLFGRLLLMTALREAGYPDVTGVLQYNQYGRPYLPGGPDFNISHAGRRVACIIGSHGGVGIDLEEVRDLSIGDFRGQFTEKEWMLITGAQTPLEAFYHFWTAKEALVKADGRGLHIPMDRLEIEEGSVIRVEGRDWHLRRIGVPEGYICHIALEGPVEDIMLREMSWEEIVFILRKITL